MTTSPEFLVVEDHPMVMRTLRTYLQRVGTVLEAGTVQEGLRVFEQHTHLAGMLVDVNLPDGLGTDLIREIRRRDPVLPILMLTGSDERGWANEAHTLGVEFVFKPIVTESLERFSARAVARASSGDDSLAAVVSELVSSHGLSPREVQVLTLSLGGTPRVALTDEMGVSDNTVKTTVRHLLRKTTADTLDDLVQYVMRAALQRRSAPETAPNSGQSNSGQSNPGQPHSAQQTGQQPGQRPPSRPPARRAP